MRRGLIVSWLCGVRLDAADSREMRVAVPNTCPSLADSLDHLIVVAGPGGFFDAALGFVLVAVDAPGVDPQQAVSDTRTLDSGRRRANARRAQVPGSVRKMPAVRHGVIVEEPRAGAGDCGAAALGESARSDRRCRGAAGQAHARPARRDRGAHHRTPPGSGPGTPGHRVAPCARGRDIAWRMFSGFGSWSTRRAAEARRARAGSAIFSGGSPIRVGNIVNSGRALLSSPAGPAHQR